MKFDSRVPYKILEARAGVEDACNNLITKASEIANQSERAIDSGTLVEKAFRALALKTHPDKNPNDKNAKSNFQNLELARELLTEHRSYLEESIASKRQELREGGNTKSAEQDPLRREENKRDTALKRGLINEIFSELQSSKISIDSDSKTKTRNAIIPVLEGLPLEFLREGKKSISQQIQATAKSVSEARAEGRPEAGDRWLEIRKNSLMAMAKQYEASQDKSNFFAQAPEPAQAAAPASPVPPAAAETRPAAAAPTTAVRENSSKTKKSSDKKSFPASFIDTIRKVLHRPPTGVKPSATPSSGKGNQSQSNWFSK